MDKLRENMHDMRSHRLDHPGRAPPEELPEKPFGLVDYPEYNDSDVLPDEQKPKEWTVAKEAGLRIGNLILIYNFWLQPGIKPLCQNFMIWPFRLFHPLP